MVFGIELRTGLNERGRGDDAPRFGRGRVVRVAVDRIVVADSAGEHQYVAGFDRESFSRHARATIVNGWALRPRWSSSEEMLHLP